ncbi:MAG: hypothetical protein CMK07_07040 [Ponticaulis sp.]|nr:hypothetical protein [Ponticaulis sp.]
MSWKWTKRIAIGFAASFVIFTLIPLIYVELTVPARFRTPDPDSLLGRNSRLSNLAIIHDYKKEGRRVAVVDRPILFLDTGIEQDFERFLVVAKGYKTDFASLPSAARLFFSPFADYAEAAIIHDWLYAIGRPGAKREADLIFLRAMLDDGVSPVVARYFYTAVRFNTLFGGGGFGRESEWTNGFYSTYLETDFPAECAPIKPNSGWYSRQSLEDVGIDMGSGTAALSAVYLQGFDPVAYFWEERLASEECQEFILTGINARMERYLTPYFAKYEGELPTDRIREFATFFAMYGELTVAIERRMTYRRFLEPYLETQLGRPVPETFWCLDSSSQAALLTNMLVQNATDGVWPVITCGTTASIAVSAEAPSGWPDLAAARCRGEPYDALDFSLGRWAFQPDGSEAAIGIAVFERSSDGCRITKQNLIDGEVSGEGVTFYNPVAGVWMHDWVSGLETYRLEADPTDEDGIEFTGMMTHFESGDVVRFRLVQTPVDEDHFRQTLDVIPPDADDWMQLSSGQFVRL